MSFLRTEPSKTNMDTCKDKPFCTTPTSVSLHSISGCLEDQCSKWGTNGPRGTLRVEFSGREKVYVL
jgi:hypothetical protein